MRRARLMVAGLFLKAARFLAGEAPLEELEVEDEDDLPMPAGHPVVVRSERAEEMILEGLRRSRPTSKQLELDAPLAGSLRDRMNRRDW